MRVIFNGRVLCRRITGVERYATETLKELDRIVDGEDYAVAIPRSCNENCLPKFRNIKVIKVGNYVKGYLWDQIILPIYSIRNKCVIAGFDYTNSVLMPGISTIHDMGFKENRVFFCSSIKQRLIAHKLDLYCKAAKRAKGPVFTVSEYQKHEIVKFYSIPVDRIVVAGNAWQHMRNICFDDSVFEEFKIKRNDYYFSLGSNTRNKNLKWVYEVAKRNKDDVFVIVGGNTSISESLLESTDNIKYLGYQSNERVKSLYANCRAFIFPSIYEGFGIPPLEAMSMGARVVISDIACFREIYGNSAAYVDPYDYEVSIKDILARRVDGPECILEGHSWEKTAHIWKEQIEVFLDKGNAK